MSLLVRDISTAAWILSAFFGYLCILLIEPLPVICYFAPRLYLPWTFEGNIKKAVRIFVKGPIPIYCSSHFGEALR